MNEDHERWYPRTPAQVKKLPLVDAAIYSLEEYARITYLVNDSRGHLSKALQMANDAFASYIEPCLTPDNAFVVSSVKDRKRVNRVLDVYFKAQSSRERAAQLARDAQNLVERLAGRFDMLVKGPEGLKAFRTRPDLLAEATRDELRDVAANFKGAATVLRKCIALCDKSAALYRRFTREVREIPGICLH